MDSSTVISQISLVSGCISAFIALELFFSGLLLMSLFMCHQPCIALQNFRTSLALPFLSLTSILGFPKMNLIAISGATFNRRG